MLTAAKLHNFSKTSILPAFFLFLEMEGV